jgi:hypothetical protein
VASATRLATSNQMVEVRLRFLALPLLPRMFARSVVSGPHDRDDVIHSTMSFIQGTRGWKSLMTSRLRIGEPLLTILRSSSALETYTDVTDTTAGRPATHSGLRPGAHDPLVSLWSFALSEVPAATRENRPGLGLP